MKLEWAQFFAKYLVIFISAIWALCTSSDYISKQTNALELHNLRLSKNSIGVAEHFMSPISSGSLWGEHNDLCTVSGKYMIKNSGELPVAFEAVTFNLYEIPPIKESELSGSGVISKTISLQIANASPLYSETINQIERIGIGGQLERLFKYTIKIKEAYSYAVVSNASGGLATTNGKVDMKNQFGEYEMQHVVLFNPCQ
ncbi:MAG TPA: hypothetical protein DIW43_10120 [Spongiibacteraceae bacterium]|nr:hypothetical protein [Spongiibacteraceae bacterium]HCS27801.1 hypothetical protein [Spongiibacteraceae bacterium]|tara:strand:+ start:1227 stop:1826 length:600 start_codon:yes stop_codon:yes gene_type:complete